MIVPLTGAPPASEAFLDYLRYRLREPTLELAAPLAPVAEGWETHVCRFRLRGLVPGPKYFGPLVFRMYCCAAGLPRIRHEFAVQRHLKAIGYRVAEPVLLEEDVGLFGGPFMVMKEVPGRTLLDRMLHQPWRIIDDPGLLAEVHARLHRLPADGFPRPRGAFLDRRLDEMEAVIASYGLDGLEPGLNWLRRNRPRPAEPPCVLHLDFHPANVMVNGADCTGVLDWPESDVGDRHADVATTLTLIRTAPVEFGRPWQRLTALPGRGMLDRRYRRAYARLLPLDAVRLSYYLAWAALRRLCRYGMWMRAGPWVTGSKPTSLRYLSPRSVDQLCRCFERESGIDIALEDDTDSALAPRATKPAGTRSAI